MHTIYRWPAAGPEEGWANKRLRLVGQGATARNEGWNRCRDRSYRHPDELLFLFRPSARLSVRLVSGDRNSSTTTPRAPTLSTAPIHRRNYGQKAEPTIVNSRAQPQI